ncbi:MAG: cupin domain-containing protein [Myxococcota bacterium]
MSWSRGPNLFDRSSAPATGERFEVLARLSAVLVERVVSSGSPNPDVYDQVHDEWVVLLRGEATIEVAGTPVELQAGDTLLLPMHTPHRVVATSEGALWLAVHAFSS